MFFRRRKLLALATGALITLAGCIPSSLTTGEPVKDALGFSGVEVGPNCSDPTPDHLPIHIVEDVSVYFLDYVRPFDRNGREIELYRFGIFGADGRCRLSFLGQSEMLRRIPPRLADIEVDPALSKHVRRLAGLYVPACSPGGLAILRPRCEAEFEEHLQPRMAQFRGFRTDAGNTGLELINILVFDGLLWIEPQ